MSGARDYFEFHESPQDLFDDPADYQEAMGNRGRARAIRAKRDRIVRGDDSCDHGFTVGVTKSYGHDVVCELCGETLEEIYE